MALRVSSLLGFFPSDVPMEEVHKVPMIVAVSEHAILWCQKSPISVNSTEFPVLARRLLRKEPLSFPGFLCLATYKPDRHRLFLTPLAPMTSRKLAHHATCVLPVPVPKDAGSIAAAAFATATRLFVPIAVKRTGVTIVSITSSSPLFDDNVTFEVSMYIHFTDNIPFDVSLTVEEIYPDHIYLLSYENWFGSGTLRKCSFRYIASRITGEVISSECVMEHRVDFPEVFHHRCYAAKQIARMAGRRLLSNEELEFLKSDLFKQHQENWIFEPVKLYTIDASEEMFTVLLNAGGRSWTVFDLRKKREYPRSRTKIQLDHSASAASSRSGRVVARIQDTVVTGFIGGALPRLEEAARAACHALLSKQQQQRLRRANEFDFISFLQFCARLEDKRNACAIL